MRPPGEDSRGKKVSHICCVPRKLTATTSAAGTPVEPVSFVPALLIRTSTRFSVLRISLANEVMLDSLLMSRRG